MAKDFAVQMREILDSYSSKVKDVARTASETAAKESVRQLRAVTDPRASGDYARGWTVKKESADTFVVWNKTNYRLTHLLENGHVAANQYGSGYKRVPAIKHIEPAEQAGIETFEEEIRKGLS